MKALTGNHVLGAGMAIALLAFTDPTSAAVALQDSSEQPIVSEEDAPEAPGFNGVWERNPDESDDPREKLREMMGGRGGPGRPGRMPGGPPPGGFGGPGGGRPGRPPGDSGGRGGPARMDDLLSAAESIETALTDGEFHLMDSERVRIYYLDGQEHARETPGGVRLETVAETRGDQIIIEEESERGMKITQTFALAPDGNRMVVTHRLEGGRLEEPVVIRSVYELLQAGESP